jgi:hypothetical protein
MDPSTHASMNGAQHANGQSYSLLDGIQAYGASDNLQSGDDLSRYFDPELFESTTIGNGFSQPSMSLSQDFEANATRQSSTPDIMQYNVPQQSFTHHQFSQPFYNSQQMNQPTFDPRMYSRPSPSPVSFESGYTFQPQMNYTPQHFASQQMNLQQRQPSTQSQNYPPRQQQQYVNIAQRPTQLPHPQVRPPPYIVELPLLILSQNADMMRFGSFQVQDQPHQSNRFVDPSMLTANQTINSSILSHCLNCSSLTTVAGNNNNAFSAPQSYMQSTYFKPDTSLDPRSIQSLQPMPPMKSLQPGT